MKLLLSILFFYVILFDASAQKYDLIVTNKGESIAGKVDSVSSSAVFSRMKCRDAWVHTHANLNRIASVEDNVVGKGKYVFQLGSSYLKPVF